MRTTTPLPILLLHALDAGLLTAAREIHYALDSGHPAAFLSQALGYHAAAFRARREAGEVGAEDRDAIVVLGRALVAAAGEVRP